MAEKWDSGKLASIHCTTTTPWDDQDDTRINFFASITRSFSDGELKKMKEPAAALKLFRERTLTSDCSTLDHHINLPSDHTTLSRNNAGKRNIVVMKYLVPTLLLLVGVKYQPAPDPLFQENAIQIGCFVGSVCVYWPIIIIMGKWTTHLNRKIMDTLDGVIIACNFVSVFSLMSLLLPQHLSLPVFITSVLFSLLLAAIVVVCVCCRGKIARTNSKIRSRSCLEISSAV